jgi:hypothetical protein
MRAAMHQSQLDQRSRPVAVEPGWYRLYYQALTEGDRSKAITKIERAERAIHERFFDLHTTPPSTPREPQDLRNALTYLGILMQHIGSDSGSILWD